MKILVSDGVADTDANLLREDVSAPSFQATLSRRDASVHKIIGGKKKEETHPNVLILLKSPKRSWMFQFYSAGEKGTATVIDREELRKALADLIG
jgi:hypothetical protein